MGESLFPVDLTSLFTQAIAEDKRAPDGKLHASSDLTGSLRHVQLRALGVPTKTPTVASQIRLMTGTLWHRWLESLLHDKGIRVWTEVKLDEYMPDMWGGTADYVFYHPEYEAFVLGDLKTTKGESLFFINRDGAKEEHIWQLSAYFHALVAMGLPMVEQVGVLYVPMNDISGKSESPAPSLQEIQPYPAEIVLERQESRSTAVRELINAITPDMYHDNFSGLTELLAPVQERVQKLVWDKSKSVFNVVLTPHWSAAYCDWGAGSSSTGPDLCDCSQQGVTKIGEYDLEGEYSPRNSYEGVPPSVSPTQKELNVRRTSR